MLLRILGVSASAFYRWQKGWKKQPVSQRARQMELLVGQICKLFGESKGRYGSPRIHRDLLALGIRCSQKRVAWLMKEQNLVVRLSRRFVATTEYLTHEQAKTSLFHSIEVSYNRKRRHSALGYISPHDHEQSLLN
jgi:transposase InsO family protein